MSPAWVKVLIMSEVSELTHNLFICGLVDKNELIWEGKIYKVFLTLLKNKPCTPKF